MLWQGANRLEADTVEIDRDNNNLKAHGHVVSQLLDKKKDDSDPKADTSGADSRRRPRSGSVESSEKNAPRPRPACRPRAIQPSRAEDRNQ